MNSLKLRVYGKIAAVGALAPFALAFCLPIVAHAQGTTVLTFDFGPNAAVTNGTPIPQDYGDNVTAATMGAYSYGGSAPFTPNITALYSGGSTGPAFFDTGFGDLTNVAFGQSNQLLLVTLIPDASKMVTLNSFDLAGFPNTDYVINAVQVFIGTPDGAQNPFNQTNVAIRGATGSPRHSSFAFSGISSTSFLTIQIDALNLGAASSNIGIDNISFTQNDVSAAAPEPGSLCLLGIAILPLGLVFRRRRNTKSQVRSGLGSYRPPQEAGAITFQTHATQLTLLGKSLES